MSALSQAALAAENNVPPETPSVDAPQSAPNEPRAIPGNMIAISENAAKQIQLQREKRGTPTAAIRVGIRGGGCTGFSYLFEWDDGEPKKTDKVFREHGVALVVDRKSFIYLRGTELDFVTSMMGHGFKFNNPNVKGSCGCGESVQF